METGPLGESPIDHSPHSIPQCPIGSDFEDLVCALYAAAGWYVSPNVRHLEGDNELMEIDLVATRWENGRFRKVLVEAKSGGWGWGQVLKLLGQGTLLAIDSTVFLTRECSNDIDPVRQRFANRGCEIRVLGTSIPEIVGNFNEFSGTQIVWADVGFWWHVFKVRREVLKCINRAPVAHRGIASDIKEHKRLVDDGLFQHDTVLGRLQALRTGYEAKPDLTGQVAKALDLDPTTSSSSHFSDALYRIGDPLVDVAMFLETRSRLAMLAAVIEYLLTEDDPEDRDREVAALLGLPTSTYFTISALRNRHEAHLYPVIWQRFVYEFGGLLIGERLEHEYGLLAEQSGASVESVKTALGIWDDLFPSTGWIADYYSLRLLKLVPSPIQGLGALRRSQLYGTTHDGITYTSEITQDPVSASFLKRVNNITYHRFEGRMCPADHLGSAAPPTTPIAH